jgi:phage-related protein
MAGAFALSSIILNMGDYSKPIDMGFALSFSISMALLALPVVILGSESPAVVAMGAIGIVLVAGGIALASHLLGYANFDAMKNMADVMAYSIGKLLQHVVPFLLPIGESLAHFIDVIEPPISRFVAGVFPLLINMVQVIGEILMPAIMAIIDGLCNILPNLAGVFNSIVNIIEKVGSSISGIINSISTGIVSIIKTITDSIMTLSNLSGFKMLEVAGGLVAIAGGFGAIGIALMMDGIGSLFGGDNILDKLLDITKNATSLIIAGKGVQYLASALTTLSEFDSKNIKKVNDIVNTLSSVSMAELAKNSGMVVTLSPADLKTILSDEDSKISVLPTNIKEQQQQVTTVASTDSGSSDMLLYQLISQQTQTNNLLSEIAKDTKSFNKLYLEIKTQTKHKEPKNK